MANQELINFIDQNLKQGTAREQIKTTLLANGWSEADIGAAFQTFDNQTTSTRTTPDGATGQQQYPTVTALPEAGTILVETWKLFTQRFLVCVGIALVPSLITFAAIYLGETSVRVPVVIDLILTLVLIAAHLWSSLAILYCIKDSQEKIGLVESYRRSGGGIFSYLWVLVLVAASIVSGAILFLVPALIFSIWFMFSIFTFVCEGTKGINALLASRNYVRKRWWGVFWRVLFVSFVGIIPYIALVALFTYLSPDANAPLIEFAVDLVYGIIWIPFELIYLFKLYNHLRASSRPVEPISPRSRYGLLSLMAIPLVLVSTYLAYVSQGFWLDKISSPAEQQLNTDTPDTSKDWKWSEAVLTGALSDSTEANGERVKKYENKTFGISFQLPAKLAVKETLHFDGFKPGLSVHLTGEHLTGSISVNPRRIGMEGYDRIVLEKNIPISGQEEELSLLSYGEQDPVPTTSAQIGFNRGDTGYGTHFEWDTRGFNSLPDVEKLLSTVHLSAPYLPTGKENDYLSNPYGFRIVLPKGWVAEEKTERGVLKTHFYDSEQQEKFEKEIERLKRENGGDVPHGIEPLRMAPSSFWVGPSIELPHEWIKGVGGTTYNERIQGRSWRFYYESTMDTTTYVTGSGASEIGFQFHNFRRNDHPIIKEVLASFLRTHSDNLDDWPELTVTKAEQR